WLRCAIRPSLKRIKRRAKSLTDMTRAMTAAKVTIVRSRHGYASLVRGQNLSECRMNVPEHARRHPAIYHALPHQHVLWRHDQDKLRSGRQPGFDGNYTERRFSKSSQIDIPRLNAR